MHVIGFLINPVAGMGGRVGLKGTDGMQDEALRRGACPLSGKRALTALRLLKESSFRFITCSGLMGEDVLLQAGISRYTVTYHAPPASNAEDTRNACRTFVSAGAEMIVFCGGDGTARDVYDVSGDVIPLLGIPAGVKMYSSVFAISPEAAGSLLKNWDAGMSLHLRDAEVMDIDEYAYRRGELHAALYGIARSPYQHGLVQDSKQVFEDRDEEARAGIARFLSEVIRGTPDTIYILGPGSTTRAIAAEMGLEKTILGFDAVRDGRLVATDLDEQKVLALVSGGKKVRLIVSVIGAQGAVLGRGTQQMSPAVIRKIGTDQIIVVGTPQKLVATPRLFIDTGDPDLDASFGNSISVVCGYRIAQRKKLATGVSLLEKKST